MNDRDVPRETPSAPEMARGVFSSDRLDLLQRYADLLASDGVVRGLIGPREAPRLWDRHLINCGLLADLVESGASVCDIGSGAGLPGLVLAIARPDLRVTLVEPLLRRTAFLSEVVEGLELAHVEVVRGRADALHGERRFDVVTSRAVAPLDRLLAWSMPLVEPRGSLLAMKGASVGQEIDAAAAVLRRLGCSPPVVHRVGEGVVESPTAVVRVSWADPGRVSWPLAASSGPKFPPRARRTRPSAKRGPRS